MQKTILQVPIAKSLQERAKTVALDYGFSSLQEAVRVILNKLANRQLVVNIEETVIPLSPEAEKRYLQMEKDFKKGKNISVARNIDALMKQLHED